MQLNNVMFENFRMLHIDLLFFEIVFVDYV